MSNSDEMMRVLLPVVEQFNKLGVRYHVGGSVASSLHGVPRATLDVDLVAALEREHIAQLVEALEQDYYIDADMIQDALMREMSFNLLHLNTMLKIDVFPLKSRAFAKLVMERAQPTNVGESESSSVQMTTAEDIILLKMEWYNLGNRVSQKQWLDILGVFKVQGDALDFKYMQDWASKLGLQDLLDKAFVDAGMDNS